MLTILKGDDTGANRRYVRLVLPDEEIGDGFSVGFEFFGTVQTGAYTPGGTIYFNFTREQTAAFPFGVSYARLYIEKDGLRETISDTIPVCVTDSVERVKMATNDINLSVIIHTGVPYVDKEPLVRSSSVADIKELANALLAAVNAGATGPTGDTDGATGNEEVATGETGETGETGPTA